MAWYVLAYEALSRSARVITPRVVGRGDTRSKLLLQLDAPTRVNVKTRSQEVRPVCICTLILDWGVIISIMPQCTDHVQMPHRTARVVRASPSGRVRTLGYVGRFPTDGPVAFGIKEVVYVHGPDRAGGVVDLHARIVVVAGGQTVVVKRVGAGVIRGSIGGIVGRAGAVGGAGLAVLSAQIAGYGIIRGLGSKAGRCDIA